MNGEDNQGIVMRWCGESFVSGYFEPDEFIYKTSGELFSAEDDECEGIEKFRCYYVDVDYATKEEIHIFDVLDAHSHTAAEYYEPIFGCNAPEFSNRVLECLDEPYGNLLILDRLEILPKYRGKNLGLRVMHRMINHFSSDAMIVALKAFPLQFEVGPYNEDERRWRAKLGLEKLPGKKRLATKKEL